MDIEWGGELSLVLELENDLLGSVGVYLDVEVVGWGSDHSVRHLDVVLVLGSMHV